MSSCCLHLKATSNLVYALRLFEECTPRLYLNNQVEKSKESETPAIFTTGTEIKERN